MSAASHQRRFPVDFSNCACSGKSLGRLLQPAVMGMLAQECLHGYVIVQRLAGMAMLKGHPPDPAGIYRLLKSMEQAGLVTSCWDLADTGPAKRCFELTLDGRACLARWVQTLEEYERAICELLSTIRPTCESGKACKRIAAGNSHCCSNG